MKGEPKLPSFGDVAAVTDVRVVTVGGVLDTWVPAGVSVVGECRCFLNIALPKEQEFDGFVIRKVAGFDSMEAVGAIWGAFPGIPVVLLTDEVLRGVPDILGLPLLRAPLAKSDFTNAFDDMEAKMRATILTLGGAPPIWAPHFAVVPCACIIDDPLCLRAKATQLGSEIVVACPKGEIDPLAVATLEECQANGLLVAIMLDDPNDSPWGMLRQFAVVHRTQQSSGTLHGTKEESRPVMLEAIIAAAKRH
jgi:hypothetical protein